MAQGSVETQKFLVLCWNSISMPSAYPGSPQCLGSSALSRSLRGLPARSLAAKAGKWGFGGGRLCRRPSVQGDSKGQGGEECKAREHGGLRVRGYATSNVVRDGGQIGVYVSSSNRR